MIINVGTYNGIFNNMIINIINAFKIGACFGIFFVFNNLNGFIFGFILGSDADAGSFFRDSLVDVAVFEIDDFFGMSVFSVFEAEQKRSVVGDGFYNGNVLGVYGCDFYVVFPPDFNPLVSAAAGRGRR